jgi:hypothetical protein
MRASERSSSPDTPPVVEVNSLLQFDEGDIPYNKHPSQCLDEFDTYVLKQENFNAHVMKQLRYHSDMIARLGPNNWTSAEQQRGDDSARSRSLNFRQSQRRSGQSAN